MVLYVGMITDLVLVWGSCQCMLFVRPFSIEADIFSCKSKGISDCLKIKQASLVSQLPGFR